MVLLVSDPARPDRGGKMVTEGFLERAPGRRLHYRVSGPEAGMPLVFHHGTPGAVRDTGARACLARERAAPRYDVQTGIWRVGPQSARRVVDVVEDTSALLDLLVLSAAWSLGGPVVDHTLSHVRHAWKRLSRRSSSQVWRRSRRRTGLDRGYGRGEPRGVSGDV